MSHLGDDARKRTGALDSLGNTTAAIGKSIVFGIGGVIGMLAGGLGTGFAVAIFMANAGGSWDDAKKWIESGELGGKYLKNAAGEYVDAAGNRVARKEDSKNPRHGATVIGDTVGDPFKDTSGPSLNILIKLISMVSVATIGITMAVNQRHTCLVRSSVTTRDDACLASATTGIMLAWVQSSEGIVGTLTLPPSAGARSGPRRCRPAPARP